MKRGCVKEVTGANGVQLTLQRYVSDFSSETAVKVTGDKDLRANQRCSVKRICAGSGKRDTATYGPPTEARLRPCHDALAL